MGLSGSKQPPARTNWAGNVTYSASTLEEPRSLEALQRAVRRSAGFRVLGSGHSFNAAADHGAVQISLAKMPERFEVDRESSTVTVNGAMTYGRVAALLDVEGLALHNMASLPHISVAGSVATATHGSGMGNGNLASSVAGLELIDGRGALLSATREGAPDIFNALVVGLGCAGVVVAVTLDTCPSYQVAQAVYTGLPFAALEQCFHQVMGCAYSVSLFTSWAGDKVEQVWVKRRLGPGEGHGASPVPFPADLHGARLSGVQCHPGSVGGGALDGASCTQQAGVPGPWFDRLPHFRLDFAPSCGDELQSEYYLPRAKAVEGIRAMRALGGMLAPLLHVSEVRCIAGGDGLWMSPAYGEPLVAFHLTWRKDRHAEVDAAVEEVEAALEPLGARPHWGKIFGRRLISPGRLRDLYPRADDFLSVLRRVDPDGKMRGGGWAEGLLGGEEPGGRVVRSRL